MVHIISHSLPVARQQLCKHGPTRNNRGSCVFGVRSDVTTVDSDHVMFSVEPIVAPIGWVDSDHVIWVYCTSIFVPRLCNESREQ
jgi:hypothetical protein